jgi:hypothetical protein
MPLILNRNPKIPFIHFEIPTVKGGVFSGFLPISVRIDGINRQMNQKVVVWEAKIYLSQKKLCTWERDSGLRFRFVRGMTIPL